MSNCCYVYIFLDPTSSEKIFEYNEYKFYKEPFYIGKGKSNRWKDHFKKSYLSNKNEKSTKIKKLLDLGYTPNDLVFIYKTNLSESESFKLEIDLIKKIGRVNLNSGPLLNKTCGGEGTNELLITESFRNKQRILKTGNGNPMFGKTGKDCPAFGMKRSKEFKEKLKNNNKIYSYKFENLLTGEIVHSCSLRDFCKNFKLDRRQIQRVVLGKRFQHNNWIGFRIGYEFLRRNVKKDLFNLCSPEGIFYLNILSLRNFCKDHNLNYSNMLYHSKKRTQYQNWLFI